MAQLFIAFSAPEDDLVSIPCTYMTAHNCLLSPVPGTGCPLLTWVGTRHICDDQKHICRQSTYTHKIKKQTKKKKEKKSTPIYTCHTFWDSQSWMYNMYNSNIPCFPEQVRANVLSRIPNMAQQLLTKAPTQNQDTSNYLPSVPVHKKCKKS